MALMKAINNIHSGSDNLHTKHIKAVAHTNFMGLYQEKFQDIKEFHDQYLALRKVCTELGFGRCEGDVKVLLLTEGMTEPGEEQSAKGLDKVTEKHH